MTGKPQGKPSMPDPGKPAAETATMTIKSFPVALRQRVVESAERRDETVGEWMARAAERQANQEANDGILPPANQGLPTGQTMSPAADPAALASLIAALAQAKAAGVRVPQDVAHHAFGLLRQQLRQARGLPPPKPRQRGLTIGQTTPEIGQTIPDQAGDG